MDQTTPLLTRDYVATLGHATGVARGHSGRSPQPPAWSEIATKYRDAFTSQREPCPRSDSPRPVIGPTAAASYAAPHLPRTSCSVGVLLVLSPARPGVAIERAGH